ncbi:hypothetical protein Lal_00032991 [Lupinus albus]|nr:hypothetical protein Lal_00032991 [Lupinus albus]
MVGMRKDPKVVGGVGGTYEVAKNQTQHSPSYRDAGMNYDFLLCEHMVAALQQVNENLHNLNQNSAPSPSSHPLVPPGPAEYQGLDEFCRRNPSQFHGGFAPDAAIE